MLSLTLLSYLDTARMYAIHTVLAYLWQLVILVAINFLEHVY